MTKTIEINYAPSEDSDQTGPVRSESSVANCRRFLYADSEDSGQTGWMPRLICLRGRKVQCLDFYGAAHMLFGKHIQNEEQK